MQGLGDPGDHRAGQQEDRQGQPIGRLRYGELARRLNPEVISQYRRQGRRQQARTPAPIEGSEYHGRIEDNKGRVRAQYRQERQSHGCRGKHRHHGHGVSVERRTRLFSQRKQRQIRLAQRGDGGQQQIEPAEPLRRAAQPVHDAPEG